MSSECNNVKLAIRNNKSKVVCAMCKQCLITTNHDVCVLNYVNEMNSRDNKQSANVSNIEHQKKQKPKVKKPKKVGSKEILEEFLTVMEPISKRFPNSTSFLGKLSKFIYGLGAQPIIGWTLLPFRFRGRISNEYLICPNSVGQFCDSDLEVAFRRNSCFVRSLEGVDLLKGNRSTNLYTINLHEMASASPICLMARALQNQSWLLASTSKDEAPEVIKTFLKRITVLLQSPVIIIRTDNGTEFKNQILKEYFDSVGISHQASSVRTPQQNGVVERRNRTLVEAARTMLIFSRAPLFLWAEAIATACYTQNRSIIHPY
ncbi:retrovirus-related pol polyprotein from transposon TNT 1-94 [Tanacetum coccineum]